MKRLLIACAAGFTLAYVWTLGYYVGYMEAILPKLRETDDMTNRIRETGRVYRDVFKGGESGSCSLLLAVVGFAVILVTFAACGIGGVRS